MSDTELKAPSYNDALILPFNPSGHLGGVTIDERSFLKDSTLFEWDSQNIEYVDKPIEVVHSAKSVIYIGVLLSIFGHCITDNLKKVWFLHTEEGKKFIEQGAEIVYISYRGSPLREWVFDILDKAGVPLSRVHEVITPTRYHRVIIPDHAIKSIEFKKYVDIRVFMPQYKDIIQYIKDTLSSDSYFGQKRIYLSRTKVVNKKDFGERRVEALFYNQGYTIVHPQDHSFSDQVNIMAQCSEVVATEGSVSHLAMFCNHNTKLVVLKKIDWTNPYQECINKMVNLDVTILKAHHSINKLKGWEGPFYISPTREVCNYLNLPNSSDFFLFRWDYYEYLLIFMVRQLLDVPIVKLFLKPLTNIIRKKH